MLKMCDFLILVLHSINPTVKLFNWFPFTVMSYKCLEMQFLPTLIMVYMALVGINEKHVGIFTMH